jgi:hypothetical protein
MLRPFYLLFYYPSSFPKDNNFGTSPLRSFLHSPAILLRSYSFLSHPRSNTCFGLETQFYTSVLSTSLRPSFIPLFSVPVWDPVSYLFSQYQFETQFHTSVLSTSFLAHSSKFRGASARNRHYLSLLPLAWIPRFVNLYQTTEILHCQ